MSVIQNNKKAYYDYFIEGQVTCGIVLEGTEVKSIRAGNCSIKEAYCYIRDNEVWLKSMFVKEYMAGSYNNHDETRERKLLLNRKEITKLAKLIDQKGFSLLPLKVLLLKGRIKIEIGAGKGKKLYDKRDTIKQKDIARDLERE